MVNSRIYRVPHGLVILAVPALLASGGCLGLGGGGGGGGLFGFFGGGDSGSTQSVVTSDTGITGFSGGTDIAREAATLNNPEPASMALFGGGLAGLALLRRRKARGRSSR